MLRSIIYIHRANFGEWAQRFALWSKLVDVSLFTLASYSTSSLPLRYSMSNEKKKCRRPTSFSEKRAHLHIPHAVCFWRMEAQDFNLVDFLLDLTGPWWEIYRMGNGKLPHVFHSILLDRIQVETICVRRMQAAINSVLGGVLRALMGTFGKRLLIPKLSSKMLNRINFKLQ